jgi:hypothetical protein
VHRLLGEQAQHGGADVAAGHPAPAAATVRRAAVDRAGPGAAGVVVALAGVPALAPEHGVHELLLS